MKVWGQRLTVNGAAYGRAFAPFLDTTVAALRPTMEYVQVRAENCLRHMGVLSLGLSTGSVDGRVLHALLFLPLIACKVPYTVLKGALSKYRSCLKNYVPPISMQKFFYC